MATFPIAFTGVKHIDTKLLRQMVMELRAEIDRLQRLLGQVESLLASQSTGTWEPSRRTLGERDFSAEGRLRIGLAAQRRGLMKDPVGNAERIKEIDDKLAELKLKVQAIARQKKNAYLARRRREKALAGLAPQVEPTTTGDRDATAAVELKGRKFRADEDQ